MKCYSTLSTVCNGAFIGTMKHSILKNKRKLCYLKSAILFYHKISILER